MTNVVRPHAGKHGAIRQSVRPRDTLCPADVRTIQIAPAGAGIAARIGVGLIEPPVSEGVVG